MNTKLKITKVSLETKIDDVTLKGQLEFSTKDYSVNLIEPFKNSCGAHMMYAAPTIYVYEKSVNPRCIEFELKEKSIEILKSLYLNKKEK